MRTPATLTCRFLQVHRSASFALAAVAVLAAACLSAPPASAAGIFVRSAAANRANEADLVTQGPNHTLQYYFATPGGQWHHTQVAGPGTTYSTPSIFVRSPAGARANEADIVAEGPNHTLRYYLSTPRSPWQGFQIGGAGTTYSAPSIFVRSVTATPADQADIVAEGPNHTLRYYFATPGSPWQHTQIARVGSTYSAPSIFVQSATATQPNQADIVAEGASRTLLFYWATPGGPWEHAQVASSGTTYSAPSIFVRSPTGTQPNEADIVAEGPNHTLRYYLATPGKNWQGFQIAGTATTYSLPSIFVRSATAIRRNEADVMAEGPNHTLRYYFATPGSPWHHTQVAGAGTTYLG